MGERYEEYLYNPFGGVYAWALFAACACWVVIDLRRKRRPLISAPLTAAIGIAMLLRLDIDVALVVVLLSFVAGHVLQVSTDATLSGKQRAAQISSMCAYLVFLGAIHHFDRFRPQVVSIKRDSVVAVRGSYVEWVPRKGLWVTLIRHRPGGREVWMVRSGERKPSVISLEADETYRDRSGNKLTGAELGRRIASWAGAAPIYKDVKDESGIPPLTTQ